MAKKKTGSKGKSKNGNKKHKREINKRMRRGSPISAYVRNVINASTYFQLTGQ